MTAYIGIDPGLTGALCVLPTDGRPIKFFDTPVTVIKSGKKLRRMMDVPAVAMMLEGILEDYEGGIFAVVEKVSPMPSTHEDKGAGMGVTSAFNYGKGVGIWLGCIATSQIPYEEVHPARWKKLMMPDQGKGKDASRVKAVQLYPETAKDLQLVKHHGRADALLMARYGLVTQPGNAPKPQKEVAATLFG